MHGLNLILFILYQLIVILTVIHVVMDNRQPAKTMAWILVIWFVPVAGIVFYLFFGVNTRKEKHVSQRSLDQLTKRSMLEFVEQRDLHLPEAHKATIDLFVNEDLSLPFKDTAIRIFRNGYEFFPALLHEIAEARGQSLAQLALVWALRLPEVTSVLIGASRAEQVRENAKALENMSLTDEELAAIEAVLANR